MPSPKSEHSLTGNRILDALSERQYQKLFSKLQLVSLPARHVVYEQARPVRFIYFPVTAMISLLSVGDAGTRGVEVCTVGKEGVAGLSAFLDGDIALGRAIAQLPGTAARVEVNAFKDALSRRGPLNSILERYVQVQLVAISRAAFCNNFHKVEARLARLLLLTHDSAQEDVFPMTQEFAAYLLGLHRPAVSGAANALQQAGGIHYRQGKVTVLDRDGLSAAACECYGVIAREYERLLGDLLTREA
jgi:CRP-like cAMP-binding protein